MSPESFFWKWESSFDEGAGIFFTKPRDTSVQGPKKIRRITLKKNVPRIFFWTCKFLFLTTPLKCFRQGVDKNPFVVQKEWKSVCFEKHCFSLKCSYGHVECSSNKPAKKREEARNFCSVSENDKKFHLFPKQFFFKKGFYRYGECSFDRPAKLLLLKYQKWSEKSQEDAKTFQSFFLRMVLMER